MIAELFKNLSGQLALKLLPFVLTILGLIIRHYWARNIIKIYHLVFVLFTSISFVIYLLFGQLYLTLSIFFIGLLCTFLARGYKDLLKQWKLSILDYYKTKISSFKKVNDVTFNGVINKFDFNNHTHYYVENNYSKSVATWKKNSRSGAAKPKIFMKVKPRKFVPWYALIDYVLLRELKYIGFSPCVLVYDIPYDIVNAGGKEIEINELNQLKEATKNYIQKIIGYGVEVLFSSEFFNQSSRNKAFHDYLFPYIIDNFVENPAKSTTSYSDKNEAQLQLLGFMSVVAVKILSESSPTFVLQWEGRKSKWSAIDEDIFLILNRTIEAGGRHLNSNNCIRISNSQEDLVKYISTTSDKVLLDELEAFFAYLADDLKYKLSDRILKKDYDGIVKLFRKWEEMGLINASKYAEVIAQDSEKMYINEFKATFEQDDQLYMANMKYTVISEWDNIKSRYNLL